MQQPQETTPKKQNIHWFWWILAIILLIWNILSFYPKSKPEVKIPYSQFIDQVNAGNVASVQISGSEITGKFVNAFPAPTPTPAPLQTAAPNATPASPILYNDFTTTFPDTQGDPNFMSLLEKNNVVVNVTPPPNPIVSLLLSSVLPLLLFVLVIVWIGRRTAMGQSGLTSIGRSKAREYNLDQPEVTFDDVAGVDEAKQELLEVVDFLRRPVKYHKIGARIPRGVLLVGPPGTGKTLMARAVAGEAGVPFFSISASEFVEMFVGVGASRVRDLFEKAKAISPAIVFVDEIDAVGRRRGTGLGTVNDEREQTLNQLLVEMDGFDEHHETIVIAATNRPDVLDPALLRPGRFDRQVTVGLPDRKGRERILQIHTKGLTLATDVNLDTLARTTTGFSGADLANLCNEAALNAARENHTEIHQVDFESAVDRVLLGAKRNLVLNEQQRTIIAYHESGHALVAWLTPEADPVNKVTIIPRGRALGVTEQMPGEDQYNYSQDYLLARLAVMMGGRVSEEIALHSITTGAENDLAEATRLARRMITRWGMGSLGPMAFSTDEQQPFLGYELTQNREYSEELAARIDKDVQQLLKERYDFARQLLVNAREQLDLLVKALLQEETVQQEDLVRILGPRAAGVQPIAPASQSGQQGSSQAVSEKP
jgi:cell division protease FtsH